MLRFPGATPNGRHSGLFGFTYPAGDRIDQGLGDLFVIRVAGNVLDHIGIGSIEYAVDHLGVEVVVVLGHGKCGAKATPRGVP